MDRCHCRHNRGLILLHTLNPGRGFVRRHHRVHHKAADVPGVRGKNTVGVDLPRCSGHIETDRRHNQQSAAVSAAAAAAVMEGRDNCAFPSLTSLIGEALGTWSYLRHLHQGYHRFC